MQPYGALGLVWLLLLEVAAALHTTSTSLAACLVGHWMQQQHPQRRLAPTSAQLARRLLCHRQEVQMLRLRLRVQLGRGSLGGSLLALQATACWGTTASSSSSHTQLGEP